MTDRIQLCFALGTAWEDRAEYERSFRYYSRGTHAEACRRPHHRAEHLQVRVDSQIEVCTEALFAAKGRAGGRGAGPHLHRRPAQSRLHSTGANSVVPLLGRWHHGTA